MPYFNIIFNYAYLLESRPSYTNSVSRKETVPKTDQYLIRQMWLQKYTISRLTSFLTGEDVFKDDDLSMLQGEIKLTIYFLNKFCYRIRKEKII